MLSPYIWLFLDVLTLHAITMPLRNKYINHQLQQVNFKTLPHLCSHASISEVQLHIQVIIYEK